MRIGEIAKLTGLNVSNIRFYERKGLLCPDREDDSKYRDYAKPDKTAVVEIIEVLYNGYHKQYQELEKTDCRLSAERA